MDFSHFLCVVLPSNKWSLMIKAETLADCQGYTCIHTPSESDHKSPKEIVLKSSLHHLFLRRALDSIQRYNIYESLKCATAMECARPHNTQWSYHPKFQCAWYPTHGYLPTCDHGPTVHVWGRRLACSFALQQPTGAEEFIHQKEKKPVEHKYWKGATKERLIE